MLRDVASSSGISRSSKVLRRTPVVNFTARFASEREQMPAPRIFGGNKR